MSRLFGKKLTEMRIEKIVTDLDDTVYDDEDIDPGCEEEVESRSDRYDDVFEVDRISNTTVERKTHFQKYLLPHYRLITKMYQKYLDKLSKKENYDMFVKEEF